MAQPTPSFNQKQQQQQQASLTRRCYLSSVALNNIGVRLIERHCYEQAAETLNDAVTLIKRVLISTDQNGHCDCGQGLAQTAMQRLMHAKAEATPAMPLEVFTRTTDGALISDTTQEDFSASVLQSPLSSFVAFPVRLEDTMVGEDLRDATSTRDLSIQVALVLHNLGIALLCQSKTDKANAHKLRSLALRLFRRSYSALVKLHTSWETNRGTGGRELGLPCLMIVVLNSLIPTLQKSLHHQKANELYTCLLQLRSYATRRVEVVGGTRAAAAA
jgi:hypothetical protein